MMMIRKSFDPFTEFDRINEMFERVTQPSRPAGTFLPVDVLETEASLLVRAPLPGVNPEQVDVSIEGRVLTIKGESRTEGLFENAKVYRREVASGPFSRSIRLADGLDLGRISASFDNGLLTVTIPRKESEVARQIPISLKALDVPAAEEGAQN